MSRLKQIGEQQLGEQYPIVLSVVISTYFIGFGGGVVFPIIPNLGEVLGISALLVGIILSANRFSRLVSNVPAGSFVDRHGTRESLIIGLFVQAIGTSGYVIALIAPVPEIWFILARIVWGIGSAFVFATAFTIAADISDSDSAGTNMGVVRAGILFGFPTGLVLGGVASELLGNFGAFALAAGFAYLATLIAYFNIPETHVEGVSRSGVGLLDINTRTPALAVGIVNFVLWFVYVGVLLASLVLYLRYLEITVFGFGPQGSSGIFMGIAVLTAGISTYIGGRISDSTAARVPFVVLALIITSIGFVTLAYGNNVTLVVLACVLVGIGQGGANGPMMALLSELIVDEEMGRAISTNNVFGDIGGGLGPIIALPLVENLGFRNVYILCGLLPVLAVGGFLFGIYMEHRESEKSGLFV